MMMNAAISINIAVPKVATARKASAGDNKCIACLAVLRSPETQN